MNQRRRLLLSGILATSILALACLPCKLSAPASPTPLSTIQVSDEAAESLEEKVREAFGEEVEHFRLEITEEELTSFLAQNVEGSPLADPQVRLTPGQIHISGTVTQPLQAQLSVTCSAQLVNGRVEVTIEEAIVGGFPAPAPLMDYISQIIEESVEDMQTGMTVTELQILEGKLIIAGTK